MKTFLVIACLIHVLEGYTLQMETQLHAKITSGYNRRLRPGDNRKVPTDVEIDFYMRSLKELLEGDGKISIAGGFQVSWADSRLTWKPADYDGDLFDTSLFVSDIWTPNFVLMNPYYKVKPIFSSDHSCKVYYYGGVLCMPPDLFEASCDADVTYYPFDSQNCTLQYYIPGYFTTDIKFHPLNSTINMEVYQEDGFWSITSTRVYVERRYSKGVSYEILQLEINLQRRSTYYIVSLLLPIFLINFIQILVFVLPEKSGQRVGFSITVLLAEVVFLTIVQDKLPETSEPGVSILTYKLLVDLLCSYSMMVAVVMTSKMYHKTDYREKPGKLISLFFSLKQSNGIDPWRAVGVALDELFLKAYFMLLTVNNVFYVAAMAS